MFAVTVAIVLPPAPAGAPSDAPNHEPPVAVDTLTTGAMVPLPVLLIVSVTGAGFARVPAVKLIEVGLTVSNGPPVVTVPTVRFTGICSGEFCTPPPAVAVITPL